MRSCRLFNAHRGAMVSALIDADLIIFTHSPQPLVFFFSDVRLRSYGRRFTSPPMVIKNVFCLFYQRYTYSIILFLNFTSGRYDLSIVRFLK